MSLMTSNRLQVNPMHGHRVNIALPIDICHSALSVLRFIKKICDHPAFYDNPLKTLRVSKSRHLSQKKLEH